MKTRTGLALTLALVAMLVFGAFVTAEKSPPMNAQEPNPRENGQQPAMGRRAEYVAAFNKGDAKTVASFWTEDATYIDQVGREHKGRAAIEKLFEKVFADRKGAKVAIHTTSTKQLTDDVILEDGITEVTPADGGPSTAAQFSAVLVKKNDQWYVQSIRDSVAHPPSNGDHLDGLEWLIGEWTGEAVKGESAIASYDWAENQNFIVSHFATTLNGEPVVGGTQWIGWDTVEKKVRSWTFYSGGGHGGAVWTQEGNKWSMTATAKTTEGRQISATNIVTKVDNDNLTWQMTKLTVDGQAKPDPEPIKMKRVKQ